MSGRLRWLLIKAVFPAPEQRTVLADGVVSFSRFSTSEYIVPTVAVFEFRIPVCYWPEVLSVGTERPLEGCRARGEAVCTGFSFKFVSARGETKARILLVCYYISFLGLQ
jgi:hypothetical protein